jgi:CHAT domain-containing protein
MCRLIHKTRSLPQPRFTPVLILLIGVLLYTEIRASTPDAPYFFRPVPAVLQEDDQILALGDHLERELKGGETHNFALHLRHDEFLRVDVEQKGIDVEVTLLSPSGGKLVVADSPNDQYGPELVVWESRTAGAYKLQVRAPNKKAPSGRYEIRLVAQGPASVADRNLIAAARAFEEAEALRTQRTASSRLAAIEKYQQALALFQIVGDKYWQALTLYSTGSTYAQSSNFRSALNSFSKALPLFQTTGDRRREAATLNFIGGVHDVLGDQSEALDDYRQALAIYEQVADRSTKASVLNNIGKIQSDMGQWQSALDYYNQALPILRAMGDQRREPITLYNIGLLYYRLGDLDRSLSLAEQSLQLRRVTGDKDGEANTLDNLGLVYLARGDPQKALDYYAKALPLRLAVGDPRGEATTLDFTGVVYSALNQPQKALSYHEQALQVRRKIGDRRNEALTLLNLGHVYDLLADPTRALENYNQALTIFRAVEDRNSAAKALVGVARLESKQGNFVEASKSIEEALSLIEEVRAQAGAQELRASYFASKQDAYELYIDLLMQQHRLKPTAGHDVEALQASERARARSLLELLNEAHVDVRQGVDTALIDRERNLTQRLNAKAQRQIRLLSQKSSQEQLVELDKDIRTLEDEYQQVQATIRKASPGYAALTQPQPLSLKEIQQQLDKNTLLLEYSLGEERSYVWAVTQTALASYELPKREQIQHHARQLYELLTTRSLFIPIETTRQRLARIAQADSQLREAARELGQMVLGPVGSELGTRRLVVVADGALQYVPFSVLSVVSGQLSAVNRPAGRIEPRTISDVPRTNAEYKPLIVDHEIISLPSASALAVQRRSLAGRPVAENEVAVIADPVFSVNDPRLKRDFRANGPKPEEGAGTRIIEHLTDGGDTTGKLEIRRLVFTRSEAEQILAVTPRTANLKALDFKASRATVTAGDLSHYRYVHFATHGYLDSQRPDLSAIVLSLVDEQGNPQDGFLRVHEIYNLDLPAELVVLSACQTGLGKEIKGEGLVGLTRGFMYAGARRVVVSLWNVNDKATAELMQRFYRGMLKENQTPAASLRKAQAEMLQQKQWQSPYYWAAFVLQGEWK